uniref:Uncharacterized protein n=1 Tax=Rhizophora mucronata TaxID=61149 RepID=A0A2P2KVZ7_RHIMU
MTCSANALEPTSCDKLQNVELSRDSSQQPSFPCEDLCKQLCCSAISGPSWSPKPEEVEIKKRPGKLPRNNGGCLKRQRMAQLEDMTVPAGENSTNDLSDKLGPYLTKCDSYERTQLAKQRNNSSSKRVDKRNFKVSMKNKHEWFSAKATFGCFSSSGGGNNIFGSYGLKMDVHDITKLVDDLSLNDLLDGTYQCPRLGKDKCKKASNMSESIVQSVRNAYSILHGSTNEKMATCMSSSVSIISSGDNLDPSTADLSSSNKDCCSIPETPVNLLDFSLYQPKDILDRLALSPPEDLESLLQDAAKPAASSKNAADPRSGKQISRQVILPAFAWSHIFNGHSKTYSDTVKLLPSRRTCQGRWVNIGSIVNSPVAASESFTDLESLAYDENLVPSYGPKQNTLINGGVASSLSLPSSEWTSPPSAAASMTSSVPLGSDLKLQEKVEHCPRLLAAAETLCDIATHISRLNQDGMIKSPKKPLQKDTKARKLKSTEKYDEKSSASTLSMSSDYVVRRGLDQIIPSKRPKLLISENKNNDTGQTNINSLKKGLLNWSTPRSSRTSPNKSTRDSIDGARHSTTYAAKEPCMKPPHSKIRNWKRESTRVAWKRKCED